MIKRDLSDILKSDMDFLSKTKQPDLANEQLAQLYEELTQQNGCQSNINPIDIDIGFRELSSDDALSEVGLRQMRSTINAI